jgi:hypothetical protein
MYATVAGRIAETALALPASPVTPPEPASPSPPKAVRFRREDVEAAREQAERLVDDGLFTQAIGLLRSKIEPAAEMLGRGDTLVLALRKHMADVMLLNRDYDEAAQEFADLARRLGRIAGPHHRLVLECRHSEAGAMAGLGRTGEALRKLQALQPHYEKEFGTTSSEVLGLREEIGRLLLVNGRYDLAWARLDELVVDLRRRHGSDHPRTERVQGLLDRLDQIGAEHSEGPPEESSDGGVREDSSGQSFRGGPS